MLERLERWLEDTSGRLVLPLVSRDCSVKGHFVLICIIGVMLSWAMLVLCAAFILVVLRRCSGCCVVCTWLAVWRFAMVWLLMWRKFRLVKPLLEAILERNRWFFIVTLCLLSCQCILRSHTTSARLKVFVVWSHVRSWPTIAYSWGILSTLTLVHRWAVGLLLHVGCQLLTSDDLSEVLV